MSSLASRVPRAASLFLLACAPAFAARLVGTVQDSAGRLVPGALVIGSSASVLKDAKGVERRWTATSDASGRFALDGFPEEPCHVTANAGSAGIGREREACAISTDSSTATNTIVVGALTTHATGKVLRPGKAIPDADDVVLATASPRVSGGAPEVYGARIDGDDWSLPLRPGMWLVQAVSSTSASATYYVVLPGHGASIELNMAYPNGTHPALAHELAAMAARDEAARNAWIAAGTGVSNRASAGMESADRANLIRLRQIVHQYGWPTGTLIGNAGMHDFWLLAQHSPAAFIAKCLPHLQAAADRGEIAWSTLALTIDRNLVNQDKPQIYGSQGTLDGNGHFMLGEVQDEAHLDDRRAEVGLGPIADYKTLIENFYRKPSSSK
jgi:hypothetical protein